MDIHKSLNHPDVWKDYDSLMEIARARGDEAGAREWQAKRDAKIAEVQRLQRGEGDGTTPENGQPLSKEVVEFITALAQAAYQARQADIKIPPDAAEALKQLDDAPSPFPSVAAFLRAIADGHEASAPDNLPPPLDQICDALLEAVSS